MARTVYVNGEWLDETAAKISIFDRSVMFADSIYEVTSFFDEKFLDFDGHIQRLKNSLHAINIDFNVDRDEFLTLHRELIKRNNLKDGTVYLQVSRGSGDRNFVYDNKDYKPILFMFTQTGIVKNLHTIPQLKMISVKEGRWCRRDIKTTQLLYSSLTKTRAHDDGVNDAVYVEDGYLTEATSSNFFIVDKNGTVITRQLDHAILPGITRATILDIARKHDIAVEERLFSLEETYAASEAFITSTTNFAAPVINLDGRAIGDGKPGKTTLRLRELYLEHVKRI